MSRIGSFLNSFLNFVTGTLHNRIGRAKYITRIMIIFLIMHVCFGIIFWLGDTLILGLGGTLITSGLDWLVYIFLGLPLLFLPIYGSVSLNNKRFHDCGVSGWWQLLLFIPIVTCLVTIYLWFSSGDKGKNDYGNQAETETREKILAWILPILYIFNVLISIFLFLP